MKNKADNEQLLDDVFAEAAPANFREAMLGETLRIARRRRRFRQTRRTAGIFVALGLLAIFIRQNLPTRTIAVPPIAKVNSKSYQLVRTQPLPADEIVTTRPLVAGQFTASAKIKIVQTTTGNFRVINDEELLALIAPRPAALIRIGPHSEELVFVNPKDATGFPLN